MVRPGDDRDLYEAKSIAHKIAERAISVGGTCTGEHGIGTGKKELLELEVGSGGMKMMRKIKVALDPPNILNAGKVFD